jgi:hypothetical protein
MGLMPIEATRWRMPCVCFSLHPNESRARDMFEHGSIYLWTGRRDIERQLKNRQTTSGVIECSCIDFHDDLTDILDFALIKDGFRRAVVASVSSKTFITSLNITL